MENTKNSFSKKDVKLITAFIGVTIFFAGGAFLFAFKLNNVWSLIGLVVATPFIAYLAKREVFAGKTIVG